MIDYDYIETNLLLPVGPDIPSLSLCPGEMINQTLYMTGNPVPEAKWVLRGRIVTNNTSPLYGNSDNIQYVIHERGEYSEESLTVWMINSLTPGGFERWFNLTVVNISEEDADDYTCVGVNAGKLIIILYNRFYYNISNDNTQHKVCN